MEIILKKGKKTALLFGASGMVGGFCLEELLASPIYEKVISFGRRDLEVEHDKLTHHIIDFDQLTEIKDLLKGDDLFCCLGTTIKKAGSKPAFRKVDFEYPLKIATIALQNQVGQFILVSAVGADPDSLVFYNQVKGELEVAIKQLDFWSIHIMRPSLLMGERKESRPLERIGMILSQGLDTIVGNLMGKYKPVNAEHVAKSMIIAAQNLKGGIHKHNSDHMSEIGKSGQNLIR